MLTFLFRGLTAPPGLGDRLFEPVTTIARRRHWYIEGEVPDTLDGRFAVLATIAALVIIRLEQFGDGGDSLVVALTERFIEVMEAEHRELGLGDPALGKTVRKLVSSLARRTELWRSTIAGEREWRDCARHSLYRAEPPADALAQASAAVKSAWSKLERTELGALADGRIE